MSSEKQFEHIENKIKEAAENNHTVFEEKSWKKMEVLLDKEDKRKPFIWLWFLFPISLIGIYGLFQYSNNSNNKLLAKNNIANNTEKTASIAKVYNKLTTEEKPLETNKNINTTTSTKSTDIANSISTVAKTAAATNAFSQNAKKGLSYKNTSSFYSNKSNLLNANNEEGGSNNDKNNKNSKTESKTKANIKYSKANEDEDSVAKEEIKDVQKTNELSTNITKVETPLKKDSNTNVEKINTSKRKDKKASKIISRFYLHGAAGADIGSVKLLSYSNSSFSAKYGVGIGYNFNKKLRLQTGFYATKKKYIAGPSDYNVKAGTYWSNIPITKVDATCLIYELPITIQYHFLQKKSFNVYAGTGVSSYIMKDEDYKYYYKRYNMEYSKEYSYSGNRHLFSTALFSLGIEKYISTKLALQLEPTLSIPLKGVGDGTVNLYSTSILLGVRYRPFKN